MPIKVYAAVLVIVAAPALARARVDQKTQIHFQGGFGGLIARLVSLPDHEGLTVTKEVDGNRGFMRFGDFGRLIDLDTGQSHGLDFAGKTYTDGAIDEARRAFEDGRIETARSRVRHEVSRKWTNWEAELEVRWSGKVELINGWDTHEQIVTVTVYEEGSTLEQSGGFVLTADVWIGPQVPAIREVREFEQRYVKAIYGNALDVETIRMSAAMDAQPALRKAMNAWVEHRKGLEGSVIRVTMTFEAIPGPAVPLEQAEDDLPGGAGFRCFLRSTKKREPGNGRELWMDLRTEILRATGVSSGDFAIPAGFVQFTQHCQ